MTCYSKVVVAKTFLKVSTFYANELYYYIIHFVCGVNVAFHCGKREMWRKINVHKV